jgi:heme/copper-type cytochrome/quinol oxidase subunit 2
VTVQLAADLGYGIPWLTNTLVIAMTVATAFFVYITLSTKSKHAAALGGFDKVKYELHKYHAERYWGILVAGTLVYLYFLGYPWMPPVAFSQAVQHPENVHTIKITAGQWFWLLQDEGIGKGPKVAGPEKESTSESSSNASNNGGDDDDDDGGGNGGSISGIVKIKAGETVKFVARSVDVNHGFSILSSSKSMDTPLMQMQVVPGYDNVFYYTFDKAGVYTIRCLEYCGWNHPYMVSQITIQAT